MGDYDSFADQQLHDLHDDGDNHKAGDQTAGEQFQGSAFGSSPDNADQAQPDDGGHAQDRQQDDKPKPSSAAQLVDIALNRFRFGCSGTGECFAVPAAGGHVVRQLRGGRSSLRAELAKAYRHKTGRIAPQQALADALLVLEGEAQDADPEELHLRVAQADGALWVDLGDQAEQVIEIRDGHWRITDQAPVLFRRTTLTGELPVPERGGSLGELWSLLNVAPKDRPLVLAWLVSVYATPDEPHAIAALSGEQGTGKSTASRLLVDLVDPSPAPLRKPPRDMDSWVTAASSSWVVGLDNLSSIPDWLSDSLCRASTGEGDVRRQLYTDSDVSVFAFRRCILLDGIDLGGLRGDMSERLLVIQLEVIDAHRRMTEHQLASTWQEVRPRLFGALLDEVTSVTSIVSGQSLDEFPRMADFAMVVSALDQVNGTHALERYLEQGTELAADSLTSDPFIAKLVSGGDEFVGTSSELLERLNRGSDSRPPKGWPTKARTVTTLLRRNATSLRKVGWTVSDDGGNNEAHSTSWTLIPPEKARIHSSSSSLPRPDPDDSEPAPPDEVSPETPTSGRAPDAATHPDPVTACPLHGDTPAPPGVCWTCDALRDGRAA